VLALQLLMVFAAALMISGTALAQETMKHDDMICADFLAGANLDNGDPDVLVRALTTSLKFLSQDQRQAFLTSLIGQVQ
jgi:hypothetical protein